MPVCKKQINEIKKGVQIRISFFIFSPSLTCFVDGIRSKKNRVDFGQE